MAKTDETAVMPELGVTVATLPRGDSRLCVPWDFVGAVAVEPRTSRQRSKLEALPFDPALLARSFEDDDNGGEGYESAASCSEGDL